MSSFSSARRPLLFPLLILLAGLLLSLGAAVYVYGAIEKQDRYGFDAQVRTVSGIVQGRMERWAEVLHGTSSLFTASEQVTRREFQRHAAKLGLASRHHGFLSLQFVRYVPHAGKEAFVAAVRADTSVQPGGHPDFTIRPPGDRPDYYVGDYIEPLLGNESAFGFDAAHTPARREAMERARDSGETIGSGPIRLVQDPQRRTGYVLREPVYLTDMPVATVGQRRQAFLGMATVVLRMDDFMDSVLRGGLLERLELQVHDLGWVGEARRTPTQDDLLYDSEAAAGRTQQASPRFMQAIDIPVAGRVWRLSFSSRERVPRMAAPLLVLAAGALASLALFRLLRLQSRTQRELAAQVASRTAQLTAANQALQSSEKRLELALAGGDLGLWDWDLRTDTLVWNARWFEMHGFPPENPTPDVPAWWARIHPDDVGTVQAALQAHLDGRTEAYAAECRVQPGPDTPPRWLLEAGKVVERDAQGAPLRMVGTTSDITQRKQAEHDRAAREAAEQANQVKSEFLAAVSHELRTPLTSIRGFAELMERRIDNPVFREQAGLIRKGAEHLNTLLNQILDLAKVEAGAMPIAPVPVSVRPVLQGTVDFFALSARNKALALALQVADDVPEVFECDELRLKQILNNLLSNALKFTAAGRVSLEVERAGAGLAFHVRDTGPGIPAELQEAVFEKFRQGSAQVAYQHGGTGLGLALSRALAELMGGSLTLHSVPGQGACFTLWVQAPCARAAAPGQ